jgi:hypothetical protein
MTTRQSGKGKRGASQYLPLPKRSRQTEEAATSATTKKTTAQYNIGHSPLVNRQPSHVPILGEAGLRC